MKPIPGLRSVTCAVITCAALANADAASLLLDFGQTNVAAPYLTLSPGHNAGAVSASDTSWNKISVSTPNNALVYGDGTAATGITLSLGQETTGGNNLISYSTAIANLNLAGTGGGVAGKMNLLTSGSIYGNDTFSTAVGRDGIFGGGAATSTGMAIGLRLDGLSAGTYLLYVMARNVNSDAASYPMNVYLSTGASAATFNFAGLTAHAQSDVGYDSATYAGQYNTFVDGENYVGLSVTIGTGDSLFLAVDGGNDSVDRRGFINSFELAPIPEPSTMALVGAGLAAAFIAMRKRRS